MMAVTGVSYAELTLATDYTLEVNSDKQFQAAHLSYSLDIQAFKDYNFLRPAIGYKQHNLTPLINAYTPDFVDEVYNLVITADTYKAQSIRIAERAKVGHRKYPEKF